MHGRFLGGGSPHQVESTATDEEEESKRMVPDGVQLMAETSCQVDSTVTDEEEVSKRTVPDGVQSIAKTSRQVDSTVTASTQE